jgi:predicted nucleotidyltransferase component of viral defense system
MVILPIEKKLKKKQHRDIALAQDMMVIEMYNTLKAIIHGGTAIWRCYSGNRFSEDIDVYLPKNLKNSDEIERFRQNLEKIGFHTRKFKKTNNSLYSVFSYNDAIVRLEAVFKDVKNFVSKDFELSNGTFILVYTLSPEDMIKEKINAYQKRKKVRDLYDIYFLLNFVEDKKKVKEDLTKFLSSFKKPVDEKDLEALIISGTAPTVEYILRVIEKWVK